MVVTIQFFFSNLHQNGTMTSKDYLKQIDFIRIRIQRPAIKSVNRAAILDKRLNDRPRACRFSNIEKELVKSIERMSPTTKLQIFQLLHIENRMITVI